MSMLGGRTFRFFVQCVNKGKNLFKLHVVVDFYHFISFESFFF
jgi:hypothetical protein